MNAPRDPSARGKRFREGDVIVTAVAHHYAIGRIGADRRTQEHVASDKNREVALTLACQCVGRHRVFLYQSAGDSKFVPYGCPKNIPSTRERRVNASTPQRARPARQSVPVIEKEATQPSMESSRTPVHTWRRMHGSNIWCQVEPMHGVGLWTASAWVVANPSDVARALRPVTLLEDAQNKADDLAREAFAHSCDVATCGVWLPLAAP